jgi:putative ABC transport system permease protein
VTRGRLAAIDLLRSLVLTALTALLALPVGLIFAWTLLKVINAESFGWTLPMHVFPASWITLFLFAQAAAFAAAAAPAARLWRTPPLVLLGVFRNAL